MKILCALPFMFPLSLSAQSLEADDGLWMTPQDDMVWTAAGYDFADIVAMANLDGDPSVVTSDEQAMIELLSQVLGVTPVSN